MISKGMDVSGYLREAGEAAKRAGLEGKIHNDIFEPSGAGANPFLTPLISSSQQKFPHMFLNKNQQVSIRKYAEKSITHEVGKICQEKGMIHPDKFGEILEGIARSYLSDNTKL